LLRDTRWQSHSWSLGHCRIIAINGGGCGGNATNFAGSPGGGLQVDKSGSTIQVGLSYLSGCFNDGGPSIGNRPDTP